MVKLYKLLRADGYAIETSKTVKWSVDCNLSHPRIFQCPIQDYFRVSFKTISESHSRQFQSPVQDFQCPIQDFFSVPFKMISVSH